MTKSARAGKRLTVVDALVIDNLACRRGGRLLFDAISARVEPGGALLLTGPNGAGKSSLLRLLAGLLRAEAGSVTGGGRRAFAGHEVALKPRQTLGAELDYWARLDGGQALVSAALAAMNLATLVDVPCRHLSSGQKRRAAIARVIAADADCWLLDEPTAGLDAASAGLLAAAMGQHRAAGGLVVAAVHGDIGLADAAELRLG